MAKTNKLKRYLYISAGVLVLGVMLMREFVWRFQSPFSLRLHSTMTNGVDSALIVLDEYTDTPVDTVRSEFKSPRKGVTSVRVMQLGKPDTLQFIAHGHYYSGMVPITFSSDRARELILIPNTEQGLALGVGELLYLDTAGKLSVIHIQSPNVGDVDSDGVFEVFDARAGAALHLDRGAKKWVVAPLALTGKSGTLRNN